MGEANISGVLILDIGGRIGLCRSHVAVSQIWTENLDLFCFLGPDATKDVSLIADL